MTRPSQVSKTFPCWYCGAADARGADHQRGCPHLPPVSEARLRVLAAACVRGWELAAWERATGERRRRARQPRVGQLRDWFAQPAARKPVDRERGAPVNGTGA